MAMLSESAERVGVDQALAFGVVNLGWGLGHTLGSWGGPALADVSSDDVTYFAMAALCAAVLLALTARPPREPAQTERPHQALGEDPVTFDAKAEGVGFEPTRDE